VDSSSIKVSISNFFYRTTIKILTSYNRAVVVSFKGIKIENIECVTFGWVNGYFQSVLGEELVKERLKELCRKKYLFIIVNERGGKTHFLQ
jgi:hypothetical protein